MSLIRGEVWSEPDRCDSGFRLPPESLQSLITVLIEKVFACAAPEEDRYFVLLLWKWKPEATRSATQRLLDMPQKWTPLGISIQVALIWHERNNNEKIPTKDTKQIAFLRLWESRSADEDMECTLFSVVLSVRVPSITFYEAQNEPVNLPRKNKTPVFFFFLTSFCIKNPNINSTDRFLGLGRKLFPINVMKQEE